MYRTKCFEEALRLQKPARKPGCSPHLLDRALQRRQRQQVHPKVRDDNVIM
jgi:hypothetical protein